MSLRLTFGFKPERTFPSFRITTRSTWFLCEHVRYILIAISEILASITGLEYAFTKAPKNMRSLVVSIFLFMSAVSSAVGEGFVGEFALFPFKLLIVTSMTYSGKRYPLTRCSFGIMVSWGCFHS